MKIGIVLTGIGVLPGRERNVSGHAQIPLRTAELLKRAGHDVHLIATRQADGLSLPECLPSDCQLHMIADGRKRGQLGRQNSGNGYRPVQLARQIVKLRRLAHGLNLDALHLFGFERLVRLAGVLKMTGIHVPVVATVFGHPPRRLWLPCYRRVDQLLTATKYVQQQWQRHQIPVKLAAHGVVRDFTSELKSDGLSPRHPHRVLYWREASLGGGGDLCVHAFKQLAPKFPDVTFTLAIRRHRDEVPGIDELVHQHANVELYRFPYPAGISLAKLIAESLCAVLPFRQLSIEPQLTVAETLAAGVPVITSDVGSLPELVCDASHGSVVAAGDSALVTDALGRFLSNADRNSEVRRRRMEQFSANWNWNSYLGCLGQVYDRVVDKKNPRRVAA